MSFDKILYPSAKRGAGPQVSSQKVRPGSFKLCRLPPDILHDVVNYQLKGILMHFEHLIFVC